VARRIAVDSVLGWAKIADQGLVRREWLVLGHDDWRRDEWPLVPFRNVDPITKQVRRVEYEAGDLATPVVWQIVDDEMAGSPEDIVYGHLSLQKRLSKMVTPRVGQPRPVDGHPKRLPARALSAKFRTDPCSTLSTQTNPPRPLDKSYWYQLC
jgi:hypothetical protein